MEHVKQLALKCDELIAIAANTRQMRISEDTYRNLCKILLELKDINRKLLLHLDSCRKSVEVHKGKVDTKLLLLQNLYYKKSYLSNEIKVCQSLSCPNIEQIEKDIGKEVTLKKHSEDLNAQHENIMTVFHDEMHKRIALNQVLDDLTTVHENNLEVLDRKRKFLEEFPHKLDVIKNDTTELVAQFDKFKKEKDGIIAFDDEMIVEE